MNTHFTFAEYQEGTAKTAVYPGQGTTLGLVYCALKLGGESGEVLENVGKAIRDDGLCELAIEQPYSYDIVNLQHLLTERREKLKKELGDVLWYISQAATELGFNLADIALDNLGKLADRQTRGVLKGSGDDR